MGMVMPGMSCATAGAANEPSASALAPMSNFEVTMMSPVKEATRRTRRLPVRALQLLSAMLRMIGTMGVLLGVHVVAAVLAAIHALMLRMFAHLHLMGMLRCRRRRRRRSLSGNRCRGNQR
jgi:hypothetical protein